MTILKGVLEGILTENQKAEGIHLEEEEDFIYIYDRDGKRKGVFTSHAEVTEIRKVADEIMVEGT